MSKYDDVLLDGRWKCLRRDGKSHNMFFFQNIYNGQEIKLSERQIKKILNGEETVSRIMTRRAPNSQLWKYGNNVQRQYKRTIRYLCSKTENKG